MRAISLPRTLFKRQITTRDSAQHDSFTDASLIGTTSIAKVSVEQIPHLPDATQWISRLPGEKNLLIKINSFFEFFSGSSRNQIAGTQSTDSGNQIMDTGSPTQERQNMKLTCHFTKKYVNLETHFCLHALYRLLKVTTLYLQMYRQNLDGH